ncbi:MAG: universal stress protein [Nitrososphaerota archaeon]|nr:universal stress protein [Nitrososphaerota archaeon]MDG6922452.1 universal stress protein [Nitrososphaerota archaeon]
MPQPSFKRILVAVDGSDVSLRAVEHAARLAKDEGASLRALYVVASPPFEIEAELADYYDDARKSAKKWMKDVENAASLHGMTIKTEILVGAISILDAIIGYAENQSIDLIVTGTRGKTQSAKLLVGSVAAGLVQYANCSVLAVR